MSVRLQVLNRLKSASHHSIEDLALFVLALRDCGADPAALLQTQNRSGGWCPMTGKGEPGVYHTALALLALRPFQNHQVQGAADRAFRWLSDVGGLESHWLWQWKFRLFDRQVRFDPSKSGWPWVPGTVSWVAPTALSILAFRGWHRESRRIPGALDMLLDRACPRGGWNAGNSVVFGVELDPHPDFTAMALLALRSSSHSQDSLVRRSLEYLHDRLSRTLSPYSLAWAVLALTAYGHAGADHLRKQLDLATAARVLALPSRTLAVTALALEQPSFGFEGTVR